MKIEIDCTPHEAREFFGLPEIAPVQERLLQEAEERMRQVLKESDAKSLMEIWLPKSFGGLEQMLEMWSRYGTNVSKGTKSDS